MKTLNELRKVINRNADYCKKKELKTIKKNQEKLANSFADIKAELRAMNIRLNHAED